MFHPFKLLYIFLSIPLPNLCCVLPMILPKDCIQSRGLRIDGEEMQSFLSFLCLSEDHYPQHFSDAELACGRSSSKSLIICHAISVSRNAVDNLRYGILGFFMCQQFYTCYVCLSVICGFSSFCYHYCLD